MPMHLNLFVVLEPGEPAARVAQYLTRALPRAAAPSPGLRIVLYTHLPPVPAHLESAEAHDVDVQRHTFGTRARRAAADCLTEARHTLDDAGLGGAVAAEETAGPSDHIAQDVLAAARRQGCDTLVLARHHKSLMRAFFEGDFEEKLLRHPTGLTLWLVD